MRSRPLFAHEMHRAPASWSSSYSATSIALELNEEASTVAIGARVFELDAVYGATRTQVRVPRICVSVCGVWVCFVSIVGFEKRGTESAGLYSGVMMIFISFRVA